jgi:DNA repair protein RadC
METTPTRPLRIRELPATEHPRTRLQRQGAAALSDAELLVLLAGLDSLDAAQRLLNLTGGLRPLLSRPALLAELPGIGESRAAQLAAAGELARRLASAELLQGQQIRSPHDAARMLMLEMGHLEREELRVVLLNTKNRVQAVHTVYQGSLNSAVVRVGEVFAEPLRRHAASIIIAHNHPSQDCTPSPEDVLLTRQLVDAGKLLDVDVLDHLVVSATAYVSLRERGLGFSSR